MSDSSRIHSLDSLRGLASLSVVFHHSLLVFPVFLAAHYHQTTNNFIITLFSNTPLHVIWGGHEAVILFFILSGYVLSLPFYKAEENNSFTNSNINERKILTKSYHYLSFIVKRVCRIYIPYMVSILLSSILLKIFLVQKSQISFSDWFNTMWAHPVSIKLILSYLLMIGIDTHNINTVTWSLIHEMRISIIFPLIMALIFRFGWKKVITIGMISISIVSFLFLFITNNHTNAAYREFLTFIVNSIYFTSFFLIGAVLAKNIDRIKAYIQGAIFSLKLVVLFVGILFYSFEWIVPGIGVMKYNSSNFGYWAGLMIDLCIAIGVVVFIIMSQAFKPLNCILTFKPIVWLGKISYSLYLIHILVILTLSSLLYKILPTDIIIFLVPIVSFGLSSVFYHFVERPSMALGRKLSTIINTKNGA